MIFISLPSQTQSRASSYPPPSKWAKRLDELEAKTDARFRQVFEAIRQPMTPSDKLSYKALMM
jgi:hypothetical protein